MIYELSNPSDPYTLEAREFLIAAAAALCLGNGAYGVHPQGDDGQSMPPLPCGAEAWIAQEWGSWGVFKEFVRTRKSDIADCLDSVLIGDFGDRATYAKALELIPPEKRQEWCEHWHEGRRSSLNNIGARAKQLAGALRERAAETRRTER